MDMSTIGNRIKNRRLELGLTQMQIKEACGIGSGHMSEIENGKKLPAAASLFSLSQALNCSIDWILTGISSKCDNQFLATANLKKCYSFFTQLTEAEQTEILNLMEFKIFKSSQGQKGNFLSSNDDNSAIDIA